MLMTRERASGPAEFRPRNGNFTARRALNQRAEASLGLDLRRRCQHTSQICRELLFFRVVCVVTPELRRGGGNVQLDPLSRAPLAARAPLGDILNATQ